MIYGYQFHQTQECWKCQVLGSVYGSLKKMDKMSINQDLGVRFEYTSVGTPQLNGRVERKFATLYDRVRSMMIDVGIEEELRQKLQGEAANMAADLDNILVINKNNKNAYDFFNEKT